MELEFLLVNKEYETTSNAIAEIRKHIQSNNLSPETIMFSEYTFCVDEVLRDIKNFRNLCNDYDCNILLSPVTINKNNWNETSKMLNEEYNFSIEEKKESIITPIMGVWFDKKDFCHAFPKVRTESSHKIPGRNEIVSICIELASLNPDNLGDNGIIYHPARTGWFPLIAANNMSKTGYLINDINDFYADPERSKFDMDYPYINLPLTIKRIQEQPLSWLFEKESINKFKSTMIITCSYPYNTGINYEGSKRITEFHISEIGCNLKIDLKE